MLISGLYTMEQLSYTDSSCRYSVYYNPLHPLYAGHFPGHPVTPGVCFIQTATELLAEAVGASLRLTGARQIKFLQMHTPEKPLLFELSWREEAPSLHGRISIFQDDTCIAKMNAQFERT